MIRSVSIADLRATDMVVLILRMESIGMAMVEAGASTVAREALAMDAHIHLMESTNID